VAAEDLLDHMENHCPLRDVYCGSCGLSMPLPKLDKHLVTDCPLAVSRCPQGCGADLKVGNFDDHLKFECPKRIVTCPGCGDNSLFADELEGHLDGTLRDQECGTRKVNCELCDKLVVAKDMPNHLDNECDKRIIVCDCGLEIVAETQSDHRILECPAVIRYCSLGCGEKMRVMEMKEHQATVCEKRHLAGGKVRVFATGASETSAKGGCCWRPVRALDGGAPRGLLLVPRASVGYWRLSLARLLSAPLQPQP
jgi:hypothetical protein